jgi:hypothetical protein
MDSQMLLILYYLVYFVKIKKHKIRETKIYQNRYRYRAGR